MARFSPRGSIEVPCCSATKLVRKEAHRLGYRFRIYVSDMPGAPHLVFPRYRALLFVCRCDYVAHDCVRERDPWAGSPPSWVRHNAEKAEAVVKSLRSRGWRANIMAECEAKRGDLAERLSLLIKGQNAVGDEGINHPQP